MRRTRTSLAAHAAFRTRLKELGAELLEPEWLGNKSKHRAICVAGHDCYPTPAGVRRGNGICLQCAGMDPAVCDARFRAALAELGATPLYTEYRGANHPHHVRCAAGHDCYPRPNFARKGHGICITCAGRDPRVAESAFRERLAELGAVPLYETWLGANRPHHVRCPAGHDCYPKPAHVRDGRGICRACAKRDPATAAAAFRARVAAQGATLLEQDWLGANEPHLARCSEGHLCYPTPGHVSQGHGVCRACKGKTWDAFYVVTSERAVKFGITSGDPQVRLRSHAKDGLTAVVRIATALPESVALAAERAVRSALAQAREKPLRGREYFDISCLALILDVADAWLTLPAAS